MSKEYFVFLEHCQIKYYFQNCYKPLPRFLYLYIHPAIHSSIQKCIYHNPASVLGVWEKMANNRLGPAFRYMAYNYLAKVL